MNKVEIINTFSKKPTNKVLKVAKQIVELCKKGSENLDSFKQLISNNLSYNYAGLKFLVDNYSTVYSKSNVMQRSHLSEIKMQDLQKQVNLINKWFELEENFSLCNIKEEDVFDFENKELDYTNYVTFYNECLKDYNNTLSNLTQKIADDAEINENIDSLIVNNYKQDNDNYEIAFDSEQELNDFVLFMNNKHLISECSMNCDYAYELLQEQEEQSSKFNIYSNENGETIIKINWGDDGYSKE